MAEKNVYSLTGADLQALTGKDLQDAFGIIHIANQYIKLPLMRTRLVKALKQAFHAQGVVFFLSDNELRSINSDNAISIGFNRNCVDLYNRNYRKYDPFIQDAKSRKAVVCKVDDIMPYNRWVNLKVYEEFYQPQNMHYKLSMYLQSGNKALGLIGICRAKELDDFSSGEVAKARILAPFITEAIENGLQFSEASRITNPFKEYESEPTSFGIIILDYELKPIYWNQKARTFSADRYEKFWNQSDQPESNAFPILPDILKDCQELKILHQRGDNRELLRRERIVEGQTSKYQIVSSLVEHAFREVSYLSFYIYLRDISDIHLVTEDILQQKYKLTKKEADIVRFICQGLTNNEISDKLYISKFTVETHLKNIFYKTGVKRRTALASLIHSS